jgi:hypothetical protein
MTVGWSHLDQNILKWLAFVNTVMNFGYINIARFADQLDDCEFLKIDSAQYIQGD